MLDDAIVAARRADARATCRAAAATGPVDVTRLQLVHYRPATLIGTWTLRGPALVIRRGEEADLAAVCEAHARAIREVAAPFYAPAEIEAWAGRLFPGIHREAMATHEFFVAVDAGRVDGFGQLDGATGEVHACYVHPQWIRRGVGARLLATLEARARARGLAHLHLDASLNAVAFYRAAGFSAGAETTHTLAGGVAIACVHMTKPLLPRG